MFPPSPINVCAFIEPEFAYTLPAVMFVVTATLLENTPVTAPMFPTLAFPVTFNVVFDVIALATKLPDNARLGKLTELFDTILLAVNVPAIVILLTLVIFAGKSTIATWLEVVITAVPPTFDELFDPVPTLSVLVDI